MLSNRDIEIELKETQNPLELFTILKNDLDKLNSQYNNLGKNKISSQVLSGLRMNKGILPNGKELEITGSRLSRSLKNAQAKLIPAILHKNPQDSKSRLELIEIFLEEEKECSLINSRDAFLLVMQEVESPLISNKKINLALTVQQIFFQKLIIFLKDELSETESKIKGEGKIDSVLEQQEKRLKGEINFIIKCSEILNCESIEEDYELNLNQSKVESHIPYGDLKNGFDPMLRSLVFLPLAKKNLNLMFDILSRLEKNNPIVGLHKSKMYEILSQIQLVIGSIGKKNEAKKKGFDDLAKALQSIIVSVKMIGDFPEKAIEKAVIHRFAYLCYYICGIYNGFGLKIPVNHLARIKKALSLLEPLAGDQKFKKIQSKLLYIISGE